MARTPPLWDLAARTEAMELMNHLWASGREDIRNRISEALSAGSPLLPHEEARRDAQTLHDRQLYDRIAILAKNPEVKLTRQLSGLLKVIEERYPEWKTLKGQQTELERALDAGVEETFTVERLRNIPNVNDFVKLLILQQERRDHLLEALRQFARLEVSHTLSMLQQLSHETDGGPTDIWRAALWGLREAAKNSTITDPLINLLVTVPEPLYASPEFTRALADLADVLATKAKAPPSAMFWILFDRTLSNADIDPQNLEIPENGDWLEVALNSSVGMLATTFFNGLFKYHLKAGDGIPTEHLPRLNKLMGQGTPAHRLARVIAASRLPYIFAIDPEWATATLIPSLDWSNENEALATWQGFTSHPTVGPDLWGLIRTSFLAAFTQDRLNRLGSSTRILSQLLVLSGIEFDRDSLPREQVRAAIKAMDDEMRIEAISWLWGHIGQESGYGDAPQGARADILWRERIKPWLSRVWPKDRIYRTSALAEKFALIVIATGDAFGEALTFVEPFLKVTRSGMVLSQLVLSTHPDTSAANALRLLDRTIDSNGYWQKNDLLGVLDRIIRAEPDLNIEPSYRKLKDIARMRPF